MSLFLGSGVTVALLALTSCEVDSPSDRLQITPSSVTLKKGESAEFVATGGFIYEWSLQDDKDTAKNWGELSTRTGDRTVYTSLRDSVGTVTVRTLTVKSYIVEGAVTNVATAQAYIKHALAPPLLITPSEVAIRKGETKLFTASGASGEYYWSLENEDWGKLSTRYGPTTKYTSLHAPGPDGPDVQKLTVTSEGVTFTAYIKHVE